MVGLERKMAHNTLEPTRGRAHSVSIGSFKSVSHDSILDHKHTSSKHVLVLTRHIACCYDDIFDFLFASWSVSLSRRESHAALGLPPALRSSSLMYRGGFNPYFSARFHRLSLEIPTHGPNVASMSNFLSSVSTSVIGGGVGRTRV